MSHTYLALIVPVLCGWDFLLLLLLHQRSIRCWVLNPVCGGIGAAPFRFEKGLMGVQQKGFHSAEPAFHAVNRKRSIWSCRTHVVGSASTKNSLASAKWYPLGTCWALPLSNQKGRAVLSMGCGLFSSLLRPSAL